MPTDFQYEVITTIRDGEVLHKLVCPDCGVKGDLDDDQFNGRVSILCDCGFHKTVDLNAC